MKLITFFLLAGLLTSCSVHLKGELDMQPENTAELAKDGFKVVNN